LVAIGVIWHQERIRLTLYYGANVPVTRPFPGPAGSASSPNATQGAAIGDTQGNRAGSRRHLLDAIQSEGRLFCVALVEGWVVGFLSARIDINETVPFLTTLPVCRITTLVVDEHHRSRGIGRALIAHCDDWAKAHDASQLKLEVMSFNARARSLYESLGFKRQSEIYAR
jgi:ribosomal protein S18 acetylase RimI-like enzyme